MVKLTPYGKFVMEHSVVVTTKEVHSVFKRAKAYLDAGMNWEFYLGELEQTCKDLREGKLQEIICMMEEAVDLANQK